MIRQTKRAWLVVAALVVCAAVSLAPTRAHADSPIEGIGEFRIGGYYPSIDQEEGLEGEPFAEMFGSSSRALVSLEIGRHLVRDFGAFGLSARIGYTAFEGDAIVDSGGEADIDETTEFMVLPLSASAYYRLDVAEKRWGIPLVPVVKAGLDYIPWWVNAGDGETATFDGDDASGATGGWHLAAALHLQLDWMEPGSSASFDAHWGVNNTYAFAEFMMLEADGFGGDGFILSDDMWTFGLAFEF